MDFLKSTGLGYRYTFLTLAPGRIMWKTSRGYTEGQHGAGRTLLVGGVYGALTQLHGLEADHQGKGEQQQLAGLEQQCGTEVEHTGVRLLVALHQLATEHPEGNTQQQIGPEGDDHQNTQLHPECAVGKEIPVRHYGLQSGEKRPVRGGVSLFLSLGGLISSGFLPFRLLVSAAICDRWGRLPTPLFSAPLFHRTIG